jgi:hypothetical protein
VARVSGVGLMLFGIAVGALAGYVLGEMNREPSTHTKEIVYQESKPTDLRDDDIERLQNNIRYYQQEAKKHERESILLDWLMSKMYLHDDFLSLSVLRLDDIELMEARDILRQLKEIDHPDTFKAALFVLMKAERKFKNERR